jgi:hypothetical protein
LAEPPNSVKMLAVFSFVRGILDFFKNSSDLYPNYFVAAKVRQLILIAKERTAKISLTYSK